MCPINFGKPLGEGDQTNGRAELIAMIKLLKIEPRSLNIRTYWQICAHRSDAASVQAVAVSQQLIAMLPRWCVSSRSGSDSKDVLAGMGNDCSFEKMGVVLS